MSHIRFHIVALSPLVPRLQHQYLMLFLLSLYCLHSHANMLGKTLRSRIDIDVCLSTTTRRVIPLWDNLRNYILISINLTNKLLVMLAVIINVGRTSKQYSLKMFKEFVLECVSLLLGMAQDITIAYSIITLGKHRFLLYAIITNICYKIDTWEASLNAHLLKAIYILLWKVYRIEYKEIRFSVYLDISLITESLQEQLKMRLSVLNARISLLHQYCF